MFKATKTTMIAGAAVVALIGIGGGVAFATSSGSPSTPNTLTAATTSTTPTSGANTPANGKAKHKRTGLLARAEHGSVTVRTKTGTEVIDLQRGQVTAVSPTSISVRSQDGFSATYVVTSTTKVRKTGQQSAIGNVADGDNVVIEAVHSGTTDTAQHIGDHGTKQPTTTH
ncbi:MAG TPA: hypothetical protein VG247_26970 [Pseudonocardiaceae bacterium]|jgi:hypothetical protein|nr:hypothetical protein [Pseudonocardiaceae bacterium]